METREKMLQILPKNSIGVEIGVFKGEFSDIIINTVKPKKLYLIDPWKGIVRSGDKNGENMTQIDAEDYYISNIVPKYSNNKKVELIRAYSTKLSEFNDNYFDWGYIDGDHSYEGVKHDLNILRYKVKKGGIIMGHDYITPRYKGVVEAVDEFCIKNNLNIEYITKDGCPSFLIFNYKN